MSVASADRAVRTSVYRTGLLIDQKTPEGRAAAQRLIRLLTDADGILAAKLTRESEAHGGPDARFTGASAISYRRQIGEVVQLVTGRLNGLTAQQARTAIATSMADTIGLLETLEQRFSGVARPLRVRQAQTIAGVAEQTRSTLLRQHATSVDRYGNAMIAKMEQTLGVGLVGGLTQAEMVASLTGHGGPTGAVSMAAVVRDGVVVRLRVEEIPEGLFQRYRYWAQRIVRTETANAYSAARLDGLYAARTHDFPDLKKKILAVFDNRTAPDSLGVHGQVRELEGFFQDGAGRSYQRPPARPNDRETVIPWREHWPDTSSTAPLSPSEQFEESKKLDSRYPVPVPSHVEMAQEHAAAKQLAEQAHAQALQVKAQADANAAAHAAAEQAPHVPVDEKAAAKAAAKAAKLAAKAEARAAAKAAKQQAQLVVQLAKKQLAAVAKAEQAIAKQAQKEAAKKAAQEAKLKAKAAAKQAKIDAKAAAEMAAKVEGIEKYLAGKPFVHEGDLEKWVHGASPENKKAIAALILKHDEKKAKVYTAETLLQHLEVNPHAAKIAVQKFQGYPLADKPAPAPAEPVYHPSTHKLVESGGGYVDVFDAAGAKVAYFKKDPSGAYEVSAPPNVVAKAGLTTQSFSDMHAAAEYATKVSNAIKKYGKGVAPAPPPSDPDAWKKQQEKDEARAARRRRLEKPTSVYEPMRFDPEARADIDARMERIRAALPRFEKLKLGSTSATAIDDYMRSVPGTDAARSWISRWLGASGGHDVAHVITAATPQRSLIDPILRRIGIQVNDENAAKLVHAIREQYAATQVALERREITERVVLRGIHGEQARQATADVEAARASGEKKIRIALHGSSSWTTRRETAEDQFGSGGGVIQSRVHASRFIFVHDQTAEMQRRYANEQEWILLSPELAIDVDVDDWVY